MSPHARTTISAQPGPQTEFLQTAADICIYGGAAGGGKTVGLILEPLRHVGRVANFTAVFFRRTTPQITNPGGLWDESQNFYPRLGGTPYLRALPEALDQRQCVGIGELDQLHNQHAAHRKMPNNAFTCCDLILALRCHDDHAAPRRVRRSAYPRGRRARPRRRKYRDEPSRPRLQSEANDLRPWRQSPTGSNQGLDLIS